jgi:hypothetical protein
MSLKINFVNSIQKKLKYLEGKLINIFVNAHTKLLENDNNVISPRIKKIIYTKEQKELQISVCGIVYDTAKNLVGVWNEKTQQVTLEKNADGNVKVKKQIISNNLYFLSKLGIVYDAKSHIPLGKIDKINNTIIFENIDDFMDESCNENTDGYEDIDNQCISSAQNRDYLKTDTTIRDQVINVSTIKTQCNKKTLKKSDKWIRPRNYAELYLPPRTILTKTYKGVKFLVEWTGTYFKSYSQGKEIRYKSLSNACNEFLKTQGVVNKKTTYDVWKHFKTLEGHSIDRLDLQPIS